MNCGIVYGRNRGIAPDEWQWFARRGWDTHFQVASIQPRRIPVEAVRSGMFGRMACG